MSSRKTSRNHAAWNRTRRPGRGGAPSRTPSPFANLKQSFDLLDFCTDDAEIMARVRAHGAELPPRVIGKRWMGVFGDGTTILHAVLWCGKPGDSGLVMLTFRQPANPFDEVRLRAELFAMFRATEEEPR
jgi:hypothetical protein